MVSPEALPSRANKKHGQCQSQRAQGKSLWEQNTAGLCQCCYRHQSHYIHKVSTAKLTKKDGSSLPAHTQPQQLKTGILLQAFRNQLLQSHMKLRAPTVRLKLQVIPLNRCHEHLRVCPSWGQSALRQLSLNATPRTTRTKKLQEGKKEVPSFPVTMTSTSSTRVFSVSKRFVWIFYALKCCCSSASISNSIAKTAVGF